VKISLVSHTHTQTSQIGQSEESSSNTKKTYTPKFSINTIFIQLPLSFSLLLSNYFILILLTYAAETLGMEGNVTERRLSVAITPLWLDSSATSTIPPPASTPDPREVTPRPETSEDGFPPNKVQIQTPVSEMPRIILPPPRHHRQSDQNFENTEVEELLAMLRETENLEDQGDILQYLVDTQGLDFNTGEYCLPFYN
jgi:hypothetical protein